jgi:hypothetical protein
MLDSIRSLDIDYARDLQFRLNRLNDLRFNPMLPSSRWREQLAQVARLAVVEGEFLEERRHSIAEKAAEAPTNPKKFIIWFQQLKEDGPGQNDPLFSCLSD